MGGQNKKRKLVLFNRDPYCHWCHRLTKLVYQQPNEPADPLMATVDHLFDRFDIRRWLANNTGETRTVLACFKCNNSRASKRSKEELRKRGKGFTLSKFFHKCPDTIREVISILNQNNLAFDMPPDMPPDIYNEEHQVIYECQKKS